MREESTSTTGHSFCRPFVGGGWLQYLPVSWMVLPLVPPKVNTSSRTPPPHCRCMVLVCLGLPPCFSFDVHPAFVTCVIHGDDIVCQTRCATIGNLCDRTCQTIEGGLLGRSIGWMSQAVSLAVLGLRSNHVSTDIKLVIPGQVYLVRPRRMGGGSSSIHEVGQVGRVC